jgi:hypothetical protein
VNRFPTVWGGQDIKADNSLPSSAEVKKEWNYTSTSPYSFMVCREIILRLHYIHTRTYSKYLDFCHKSTKAHKLCCIHASIPHAPVAITSSMKMYQCTIKGIYLNYTKFSIINTPSVAKVWVSQSVSVKTNAIS